MNVAFYAPLKPPMAPTPSGDRAMARALIAALAARGHCVEVAARLRTREPSGDARRQRRLCDIGQKMAERLVRRYRRGPAARHPALWFTYHLYYKAADWIGPRVAAALDIPYVVAEASYAPKRARGPWRDSAAAVRDAIAGADLLFGLNSRNEACVRPLLRDPGRFVPLMPFSTPPSPLAGARATSATVRLLTVARMRRDAKLRSYRVLAEALAVLPDIGWMLTIVGDGPAETEVRAMFAGLPVVFSGRRDPAEAYAGADLFVWPAVDEAYGMAMVEAQAAGLPVVAGSSGGVADTVRHDETGFLVPPGDSHAFAAAVLDLMTDAPRRRAMGAAAAAGAMRFDAAADLIDARLRSLA